MTIGERIRACREALRLTQTDLGRACGVTKQTIFKYETGVVTNIPLDKVQLIAKTLGVSAAYLMGWAESPASEDNKKDTPDINEDVKKLIEVIAKLSPENQQTLAAVARGLLHEQSEN